MRLIITLGVFSLSCLQMQASPVFTLQPTGGAITGAPEQSVGWGFSLTSDPIAYISVVTSSLIFETNPGLGTYTDFIGPSGGPVDGLSVPGGLVWSQAFKNANLVNFGLGVGSYEISPQAKIGNTDAGVLVIQYETFSANPYMCGQCATGFLTLSAPFSVTVVAPAATPEPWSFWLTAFGVLGFALYRRLRIQSSSAIVF